MDVIAAGRDLDPPDGPSYPYSPRTLVDELTMAPMALRDGEPVELEPLQDGGAIDFPEPIGRGETRSTRCTPRCARSATASAARSAASACRWRRRCSSGCEAWSARRDEEIEAAAARGGARPRRKTVSVHVVEADRRRPAWSPPRPSRARWTEWGLGGGIVSTAAPAAAAVRLLARGVDRGPRARCRPSAACAPRTCSPSSSGATAPSTSRPRRGWSDEGRRPDRDQAGRVPRLADPGRRARAGRARPRGARAARAPARARRSPTPTTRRRARASCPTPSRCSARPRWCSG